MAATASPKKQVELFIEAYNQHNIEKMLEKTSEQVKWQYNINDELILETQDKDSLRSALIEHFNQKPHARSQIKQSLMIGTTVVVIEEAFSNDGTHSQCALSIYQTKHDLIQSITYYAATSCD